MRIAILMVVAVLSASAQSRTRSYSNSLAPYVVSPQRIVDRMLELADVKPGETVYDLGSGDGRVLITAVQRFRAKAVGVEISEVLVRQATDRIAKLNLQNEARVIQGDLMQVDLTPADVVTIYLMTESNGLLRPRLEKLLKPGARVVSYEYAVPGWKAKQVERADDDSHGHSIFVYVMPRR
jgi:protein-L-isoaspartate O-methyltransferase